MLAGLRLLLVRLIILLRLALSLSCGHKRFPSAPSLISQSYMEMDQCLFYLEGDPLDIHVPNIQYLMSIHFPNI